MAPERGLTCREIVELVTEYLDGALAPADRARFEEHIAACGNCSRYLAQLRQTILLTGSLTEDALAPYQKAALIEAFRTWKRAS